MLAEEPSKLSWNQKQCVTYCFGEKKILQFLIDTAETIQTLLSMPIKDARKLVNKNSEQFADMMHYIITYALPGMQKEQFDK